MGLRLRIRLPHKSSPRTPTYLLPCVLALSFFSFTALLVEQVDDFVAQTKTPAGHNLEPTPWHLFPRKSFSEATRHSQAYRIIQCSYFSCPYNAGGKTETPRWVSSGSAHLRNRQQHQCPDFFRWIHRDLEPWSKTGVTEKHVEGAKAYAAFRVLILSGKLYVDLYYACVQSRMMFTIWGFLQLLKKYPGLVPDVDMMFDCMDKPIINRTEHRSFPVPLFRYCTNDVHFDIPFPDWSFWGWSETNIRPWEEEFGDIKQGSRRRSWDNKIPRAYWKGNPDVESPVRLELLKCNHSRRWGAQIMRQNWVEEAKAGFEQSKLSNQCNHRYKIYAEGYAWSVSLKYILSCGSMTLIITPEYEDFFSRGLVPKENYWPVSPTDLCRSIKNAVDWGNASPSKAEAIGRRGQGYMESISMNRVYDYMFHLINEYSRLQTFNPRKPSSAKEVCPESLLCFAEQKERELLEKSTAELSRDPPCKLPEVDSELMERWIQRKKKTIEDVRSMEMMRTEGST
ncbi:PREDICTED: O-glucosyltransferase rumi homolog [Tarenaya hassleriana]|uniref:O-glucosyltransferase rumi homolog n=1 Tax=Tarenaya hassleriana TaxID=28532 RepID=UPI00053C1CAE|nr:PREDICTED: O-glucosyltransferase rumi homolog [Tarenaya hassleriana]